MQTILEKYGFLVNCLGYVLPKFNFEVEAAINEIALKHQQLEKLLVRVDKNLSALGKTL